MSSKLVKIVAAGKIPIIKRPAKYKTLMSRIKPWLRSRKLSGPYFLAAASISVIMLLGIYDYISKYVYVVHLNDRELGVVEDAKDIVGFVADLTNRCGELYGMRMEPGDKIALTKEYRPDCKPQPDLVRTAIRNQISFRTEAFMLKVDGIPLVPVNSEEDLEIVLDSVKASYSPEGVGVKVVEAFIIEDLELEACIVEPDKVLSPEVVAALLVEDQSAEPLQAELLPSSVWIRPFDSRQSDSPSALDTFFLAFPDASTEMDEQSLPKAEVNVQTVEEAIVFEEIPFSTEIVYDDEMWIVQSKIETPGQVGTKELVYHITRKNGVETGRTKVSERIIEEPVTRVEAHGTAKVPSVGSGQFVWPVEDGGAVTPGRGFSKYHTGIDIHAPAGTNVLAADSGVVWFSGRGGSQGNYLILYHGSFWTLYLHNSENLVSKGDRVDQGDVIARVGSTGRSSGPHLHFEVRLDDGSGEWHTYYQHKPIDPLRFFNP